MVLSVPVQIRVEIATLELAQLEEAYYFMISHCVVAVYCLI